MDWKGIIGKVAPVLGTALGGPFGGMATKFITGKLLGEEKTGREAEKALKNFITGAGPEEIARLKELDNEFELEMERLDIKREDLNAKDRADARKMGISTTLIPQMIISIIFVLAFAFTLYHVFANSLELDELQKNVMLYLLGILSAGIVQVMNFWFGSSSGSKEKDVPKFGSLNNG